MSVSAMVMGVRETMSACTLAARRALHLSPSHHFASPSLSTRVLPTPSWLSSSYCRSFADAASALVGSSTSADAQITTEPSALKITDNCVRRLREIQAAEENSGASNLMLRLSVDGGGCSGFQYAFTLDRARNPDDKVFEKDGVKVVIDELSFSFVKGATVDYVQELVRSSFHVSTNPNSASTCGCGSSFTAR